jgi:hypothetical protein
VVFRCGDGVLLIFDPRKSRAAGREVPSHGALGAGHIAFTSKPKDLSAWRKQLHEAGVSIEQEMDWEEGGRSNKWLRWALIEASWTAIQFSGYFGAIYRNARTHGKNMHVAITMVAHRVVKIIWLLLKEKRPYTETLPDRSEDQVTVAARRKALSLASSC